MRGGRSTRAGMAVSPAFSSSFTPGLNGSPQTGTLSSTACSNGTTLTTNSPVARALLVVSLSALQVNAMYMGSWQTRGAGPERRGVDAALPVDGRDQHQARARREDIVPPSRLDVDLQRLRRNRHDSRARGEFAHRRHQFLRRLVGDVVLGIDRRPFDAGIIAGDARDDLGRVAVRAQPAHDHGRALDGGKLLPDVAARALGQIGAFALRLGVLEVGIALEHVALLDLDQRGERALAVVRDARRVGKLGEMRHRRLDRFEHQRRIADRGASAAALLAREPAVDDDEAGDLVGKIRGEGDGQPARGRMPHDDRPLPLQLSDDREYVAHVGVDGIILARAPAGFAEAALVEARHLAVARERFGDADPVVGVEVVGAVHEQDRRSPARAEGAVEDRYVAGIYPSVALHGWRLLVRACEFVTSPRAPPRAHPLPA